jgi:anthranilate/para-aminobenzoate synthase component II
MSTLPVDPSRPSFDLPKVAILDYYDSYTNNLLSLFSDWSDELIQERVIIIKYDQFDWCVLFPFLLVLRFLRFLAHGWSCSRYEMLILAFFPRYFRESFQSDVLPHIACLILSPGPGRPDRPSDFGFASTLIQAVISPSSPIDIPILGICLGHQGIATSLGGSVTHVPEILHGQKRQIVHDGKGIFEGVPGGVEMVVYNSLMVEAQSTSLSSCEAS